MEAWEDGERVEQYICMDRAEPKKGFPRSDGALYVLLLVAVLGVITLANALSRLWDWPRAAVQITLYLLLLALAWLVYRFRLTAFRYVLTGRTLSIERVVGRKIKAEALVRLSDIQSIGPYAEERESGGARALHTGRRRDALALRICENGRSSTLLISPSEEFTGKLKEQWKNPER